VSAIQLAAIPFPNIDPVALRLGPLAVHWYGLAYVAGFFAAWLVFRSLVRRWEIGISADDMLEVMLWAVAGVLLGGRLGYVLFYGGSYYLSHPAQVFAIWDGGMSFHGGLIGVLLAGIPAARRVGVSWLTLADIGAVGTPIGFFLGRLANFINGELWGRVTTVPWGVVFPGAGPLPRHPSQLYEAALEGLVLFAIMFALSRRMPPRPRGELLGWVLGLYGVFRIAVEFFRQPDVQLGFLFGGATMGQLLSIPLVAAGVGLVVWARKRGMPQAPKDSAARD
jgi:phosphatidylglycerol:prolipoprotein diacylglycerol transferase